MTPLVKKALWTTGIIVTLAVIAIPALIIYAPLYRSTTAVSTFGKQKFEELTREFKSAPTTFPALSREDFNIINSGDNLSVSYPVAQEYKDWEPSTRPIIEIPQGKTETELGPEKSPLKLVAMRVDYKTGPHPDDHFVGIYDPVTLAPLADKALIDKYNFDEVESNPYGYGSPRLTFLYQPGIPQTHHVFDARTHFEFHRRGSGAGDGFAMIHHTYHQWHSTPLKILANREHGVPVETPIQIKEGETFSGKEFEFTISLIEQPEHPLGTFGVTRLENAHTFSTKVDATRDHPVMIAFLSFTKMSSKPENAKICIELEGGKVVSKRLKFSEQVVPIGFGGVHRAKIKRAWVSESPQNSRVQFEIPGVPGLPIENEGLTNFFEAKIPYAKIPEAMISPFLANASQVESTDIRWDLSKSEWDSEFFSNIKLHEIVRKLEQDPGIFRLGIKNDALVSYETPLEKLDRVLGGFR